MDIIDRIRKLFGRNDELIPLPEGFDSKIFSQVMSRAKTPEQQAKVAHTAFYLAHLWKDGDSAHIPQVMVMVEAVYPHLERMADLDPSSTDWLTELSTVIKLTADSADDLVRETEEVNQVLRAALDKDKSD